MNNALIVKPKGKNKNKNKNRDRSAVTPVTRSELQAALNGLVSARISNGQYSTKNNVAALASSVTQTNRPPKFRTAVGGLSLEHVENIDLQGPGDYTFRISSNTFTWLKTIASNFEEYQIKMWFAWLPACPATTTGVAKLAFDYDPADTGGYLVPSDYFNTLDHCVGAIWAPGLISPNKSEWLKTGVNGDPRLFSPGKLYFSLEGNGNGFLNVRYQVSLRKPQPSVASSTALYNATFTDGAEPFGDTVPIVVLGDSSLIQSISPTTLTIAPTQGYKIVTWSSDMTSTTITPGTVSNATRIGTRTGAGSALSYSIGPNVVGVIRFAVTVVSGSTSYRLTVYQVDSNPLFF